VFSDSLPYVEDVANGVFSLLQFFFYFIDWDRLVEITNYNPICCVLLHLIGVVDYVFTI